MLQNVTFYEGFCLVQLVKSKIFACGAQKDDLYRFEDDFENSFRYSKSRKKHWLMLLEEQRWSAPATSESALGPLINPFSPTKIVSNALKTAHSDLCHR